MLKYTVCLFLVNPFKVMHHYCTGSGKGGYMGATLQVPAT